MRDSVVPGTAFDGRWRWFGQPWLLASVAVLALNDHVLKDQFPSWWTGKLSDLAGVAVLGTLLAVLLGPRAGLALTGAGFIALKVLPGVAEVATPFLGGETLRDPTDLAALIVLVPMWSVMTDRAPRRAARGGATALPVAGAIAAVLTATATSCAPGPAVLEVLVQGDTFYALHDDWELAWATSRDGVRWEPTARGPQEFALRSQLRDDGYGPHLDSAADSGPVGPQEVCADDGPCYRLVDGHRIERRSAGGAWSTDFVLTPAERERAAGPCSGGARGVLASIALLERHDGDHVVVASLGSEGVLSRDADGTWTSHTVLDAVAPGTATIAERVLVVAMTPLWITAMAAVFVIGRRRRWQALTAALSVMAGGWVLAVGAAAAYSRVMGDGVHPSRIAVIVGTVALLGSAGVAWVIGPGTRRVQSGPPPLG